MAEAVQHAGEVAHHEGIVRIEMEGFAVGLRRIVIGAGALQAVAERVVEIDGAPVSPSRSSVRPRFQ